ncbi:hypothetical protein CAI21_09905 [Alkalilimnicola ehrlichii]|uniref:PNPLA domain-containing protein n=1 Tax=Alkalilimnicola ehrlichii TaxID=351052 RepID=A0A3E0WVC8_9GAMM|nr:patatin-like phospholipase family protein [Alkalilimnicola ehrlichii]RFA29428.1 hypothetical protein CAI21_09905 [Alkalilimnicola ehrlichii]RFA36940.1 hypothetical protein CAL65_10235 [Alkalilimnicola ehrlichii]
MADTQAHKRALVLGGGGVTGIAWQLGLLLGLQRGGTSLANADLIIGTSAGSSVGAQITCGLTLDTLVRRQILPPANSKERAVPYDGAKAAESSRRLLERMSGDRNAARRKIGSFALRSRTASEAERKAIIASRLPSRDWPLHPLLITAVEAETGEVRGFRRDSEASLVDAVAASCAVPGAWPAVTIGQRKYIDGGVYTVCNAHFAQGYERVLVLSPLGCHEADPVCGLLKEEIAELQATGSQTHVIAPDAGSQRAIGPNMLDPNAKPATARAAIQQGLRLAPIVGRFWHGTH